MCNWRFNSDTSLSAICKDCRALPDSCSKAASRPAALAFSRRPSARKLATSLSRTEMVSCNQSRQIQPQARLLDKEKVSYIPHNRHAWCQHSTALKENIHARPTIASHGSGPWQIFHRWLARKVEVWTVCMTVPSSKLWQGQTKRLPTHPPFCTLLQHNLGFEIIKYLAYLRASALPL